MQSNVSRRGFASMDIERRKEIASKGGRTAHERGTAHRFTSEEAKQAGRKGGQIVSQDRAHMSEIGRQGVKVRRERFRLIVQESPTKEVQDQNEAAAVTTPQP